MTVQEVVSKAKPQEISNMINKALVGDFLGARTLLRETMVLQGTSWHEMGGNRKGTPRLYPDSKHSNDNRHSFRNIV